MIIKKRYFIFLFVLLLSVSILVACGSSASDGKDGVNGKDGENGKDGVDGHSPVITIVDGYWCVDGVNTQVKAQGTDGRSPVVSIVDGYWYVDGVSTQVKAQGADGSTPVLTIVDGYWCVNGVSTGVRAQNEEDEPELTIVDGYWYVDGVGTEVEAKGEKGHSVVTIIGGYWYIDGVNTQVKAQGEAGANVYQLYKDTFGYEGTEEEWLSSLLSGTLGVTTMRTVTYDYNGGTKGDSPDSVTVIDGGTLTLPTPEKEGHTFVGWYTGAGANDGQWNNALAVNKNLNLVARWKKNVLTVRFVDKDGALLDEQNVAYQEDAIPPAAPHVEHYAFSKWNGVTTAITEDKIFSPIYVAERYTVTFDTDGGNEIDAVSYAYNETPVRPATPIKESCVFRMWTVDGENEYQFDEPLAEDTMLRALWWSEVVEIRTAEELVAIAEHVDAKYCLMNDIDLDGAEWTPIETFSGILDGSGHKIYNFNMTISNDNLAFIQTNNGTIRNIIFEDGVVAETGNTNNYTYTSVVAGINNGRIEDLTLKNVTLYLSLSIDVDCNDGVTRNNYVGAICSKNNANSHVQNCKVEIDASIFFRGNNTANGGKVEYNGDKRSYIYFGAISGVSFGNIYNCQGVTKLDSKMTTEGQFFYTDYYYGCFSVYGGILGQNAGNGIVKDCKAIIHDWQIRNETNNGRGYFYRYYGGITGLVDGGKIENVIAQGVITNINNGSKSGSYACCIGGIVGECKTEVDGAYSCVDIFLIASENMTAGRVGGIVGWLINEASTVKNVRYDGNIDVKRIDSTGGIVGVNSGSLVNAFIGDGTILSTGNNMGRVVGHNTIYGVINKVLYSGDMGTNIGTNEGIATNTYYVNDSNKLAIYNEDFLYGESILSMDVWGICEGLSVYLKEFCCEEHKYAELPACQDKHCLNVGCTYAVKAICQHDFSEYVFNDDATCEEDGTETAECGYGCGLTDTRVKEGSAKGHSYVNYVVTKVATCEENEEETAECENGCGSTHLRVKEGSAKGHKFTVYVSDNNATCLENGTETALCEHGCGKTDTREVWDSALGHYFVQGKCVRCNIHSPELLAAVNTQGYYHVDMDRDGTYSLNDYLYFGSYPQTIKRSSVTVSEEADEKGYYTGDDGYKYVKMIAKPKANGYNYSDGTAIIADTFYYFRIEPIRWQIKSFVDGKAMLLSELVLDKCSYQDNVTEIDGLYYNSTTGTPADTFATDYEYSHIRAWLNDDFFAAAFSDVQQSLIEVTTINNSAVSMGRETSDYAGNNTQDSIFLLSVQEATESAYGFDTNIASKNKARQRTLSDYGRCVGVLMGTANSEYGFSDWWLRSPNNDSHEVVYMGVAGDRYTTNTEAVGYGIGILPALYISLGE